LDYYGKQKEVTSGWDDLGAAQITQNDESGVYQEEVGSAPPDLAERVRR
jgi:hypothetical protein